MLPKRATFPDLVLLWEYLRYYRPPVLFFCMLELVQPVPQELSICLGRGGIFATWVSLSLNMSYLPTYISLLRCLESFKFSLWRDYTALVMLVLGHSFLLLSNILLYDYTTTFLYFIYCCKFAKNTFLQEIAWAYAFISLDKIPRSWLVGSYDRYVFRISGNFQMVFQNGGLFYMSTSNVHALTLSPAFNMFNCLNFSFSNGVCWSHHIF